MVSCVHNEMDFNLLLLEHQLYLEPDNLRDSTIRINEFSNHLVNPTCPLRFISTLNQNSLLPSNLAIL